MKSFKSQGEMFGIALMFVLIVLGLIIYSQVKSLDPQREELSQQEEEYKILAQNTLNTLMKSSSGCVTRGDEDSIKNLINLCIDNSHNYADTSVQCDTEDKSACQYAKFLISSKLNRFFNATQSNSEEIKPLIGEIPFYISFELPNEELFTLLHGFNYSNHKTFYENTSKLSFEDSEKELRKLGYKRAPSGLYTWATSKREFNINLYLHYK